MTNPNDVAQLKHLDSLASHVNVLGSASSTVDGGLWFEFKDGLPVVKMNYGGSTFALGAKPTDGALIGDKLYLGGHEFKLTGFASGLTFSGNNFYVADTVVGSVSNFAFQFTDAAALSVAEDGTIAITQLDTDVVDFSLDLGFLNVNPLPAPTVVLSYVNAINPDIAFDIRSCEFTNAAAYLTISDMQWPTIGLCTNSSGNLYVTHTPSNACANFLKGITIQKMQDGSELSLLPENDLPTEIAAITNPKCWMIIFSCPNATDSNCFGEFTFVLDATDEHSSATITINIPSRENL